MIRESIHKRISHQISEKTKINLNVYFTDLNKKDLWFEDREIFCNLYNIGEEKNSNNDILQEYTDSIQLLSIRNYIFDQIKLKKNIINNYIKSQLHKIQNGSSVVDDKGLENFRIWLDTAIRIANIANRTQCTCKLTFPYKNGDQININSRIFAKLIYHDRINGFSRLFYMDKGVTKTDRKPSFAPLDNTLSLYMACFLVIVSNIENYSEMYVFGEKWNTNNKYYRESFKLFMNVMNVPSWMVITPSRIRSISEVATAIQSKFDRGTMDLLGNFSRHSVGVIEKDYLKWTRLSRTRKSFDRYICKWDNPPFEECPVKLKLTEREINYIWNTIDNMYMLNNVENDLNYEIKYNFCERNISKLPYNSRVIVEEKSFLPRCRCGKQIILERFSCDGESVNNYYDYCFDCDIFFDIKRNMSTIKDITCFNKPSEININHDKRKKKTVVSYSDMKEYVLPDVKGKTRLTYIGMDVSINGMSICTYKVNVYGAIVNITIDYWSETKIEINEVQDVFKVKLIRHNYGKQEKLKIVDILLKELQCKINENDNECAILCIEKAISDRKDINNEHNRFVQTIKQKCETLRNFEIVDVNNQLIKKVWFRCNIKNYNNITLKEQFKEIEIIKRNYRKRLKYNSTTLKIITKTMMYAAWLKMGFPHFQKNNLNIDVNTNAECLKKSTQISRHPISDIVDSCAIAMYIYMIEIYSPSN